VEYDSDAWTREEKQRRAILLVNIRDCLHAPQGYAVIMHLLQKSHLFEPCAPLEDYGLRALFDTFYRDIEEAHPEAALRLFAHCRGLPIISNQQQEQRHE